ncbi:MAG: hypothetical protein ABIB11_01800 [Candidatus Omnitrophota bacterium]
MIKFTRYNILISAFVLAGITLIFLIQFWIPTLYGADGYLHIRMAEFLRDLGPKYNFHWAKFSTFNGGFADKDFLYHLFLIPFTFFKNIFFGVKLAAAIMASLAFIVFFYVLKQYSDRRLLPLALCAFFLSDMFLQAISRPRPIAFVVLICLLSAHLMIKKKNFWIFLLGVLYALGHVTSPLIIVFSLIVEAVRYFQKRELNFKTPLSAFGGVVCGFLIHPNFPGNVKVFILNAVLVPLYTVKGGILELGAEFFPLSTREVLFSYPLVILGIAAIILLALSKRPKASFHTNVYFALCLPFFFLLFVCRRYLMQAYPLMVVALVLYISDYTAGIKRLNKFVVSGVILLIIVFGINTYSGIRNSAISAHYFNTHYENAGRWMAANIPADEVIFHANWSDSQYFIGLNPKNDYFVTLDPVYMYKKDPELYRLYRDVAFGRVEDPYLILKDTFGVRYGYAGKNYFSGLIDKIRKDKRFVILAEDRLAIIFKLM